MKKFRGIQGPWHLSKDSWVTNHVDVSSKSHGAFALVLAKMDWDWPDADKVDDNPTYQRWRRHNKKLERTASLISKAPELLEALQDALEWIDSVPQDTALPTMPGFDRDAVDTLIKEALGEYNG